MISSELQGTSCREGTLPDPALAFSVLYGFARSAFSSSDLKVDSAHSDNGFDGKVLRRPRRNPRHHTGMVWRLNTPVSFRHASQWL